MLQKKEGLDWRVFFDIFLSRKNIHYGLQSNDTEVQLIVDQQSSLAVEETLLNALGSEQGFQSALPYTVQRTSGSQLIDGGPAIKQPEDNVPAGKNVLLRLLGENAFDTFGLDIDKIFDRNAVSKDRVLYSKIAIHQEVLRSWENAVKFWVDHFKNVTTSQIRTAWSQADQPLPQPQANLNEQQDRTGIVNSLIEQCFGIFTNETKTQAQIFFNFGRLWQFVSLPEIRKQVLADGRVALSIDKEHLLSYLQVLTKNRVLFRVYQSETQLETFNARAIFFGREPTILKRMHHTLIIDRSGSMSSVFLELKQHLLEIVKNLAQLDQQARLRIVFFDDNVIAQEFNISDISAISQWFASVTTGGSTRLFATIADELRNIWNNQLSTKYNGTVMLFTDGQDTHAQKDHEKFPVVDREIKTFNYSNMPKMFAVGFGSCDEATLKKLATLMGNSYIQLKAISDFGDVFEHIKAHKSQREIIEFLVQVQELTHRYEIPFYHMNKVQVPDVVIPVGRNRPLSVTLSGNKLVVDLKQDQVPVATFNDRCAELLIKARQVVADDKTPVYLIAGQLQQLLAQANSLYANTVLADDKDLITYTKEQISSYISQLQANTDERSRASLATLIGSQQGFFNSTVQRTPTASADSLAATMSSMNFSG